MELIWPDADAWVSLQRALSPAIAHAHTALPELGAITVRPAAPDAPELALDDGVIWLRCDLLGPALHARADQDWLARSDAALAPLALDRWRRAAGLLLEGLLLHKLAALFRLAARSLPLDWRTLGWAAEQVDRLDPELGWLWQPAAGLLAQPQRSLDDAPRRGAWLLRWWAQQGQPVAPEALRALDISPAAWAAFGRWSRDLAHGPAASCPIPLPLAGGAPLPDRADALSHHPVTLAPGAAGLRVHSPHLPAPVRLAAGHGETLLLAAAAAGPLSMTAQPEPLVGGWTLASGELGQRVGAARGVELTLQADGRVEISLANAFLGPVSGDVLSLASRLGASGFGGGRWRTTELGEQPGTGTLVFSGLSVDHLTIHPRKGLKFALPGQAWQERLTGALDRLNDRPLAYTVREGELRLRAPLRSGELLLRLEQAAG